MKPFGKMTSLSHFLYLFLVSFSLTGLASSSSFISNEMFESQGSTGRSLLQAKKPCSVDFENKNYTILTSQCKGPQYLPQSCCNAFKVFACPYADAINDLSTDCATTMFSYINLYGRYPPGLFANLCREGKLGLECSDKEETKPKSEGGRIATTQSTLLMVTASLFVLLSRWL